MSKHAFYCSSVRSSVSRRATALLAAIALAAPIAPVFANTAKSSAAAKAASPDLAPNLDLETATPAPPALAQRSDEDINVRVYEVASPAVVSIDTGTGTGSGSIITADGLVLTNSHVVERATGAVTVTLSDGREMTADVVGFDPSGRDLAAVQIRNASGLPTVRFASANSVRVGQRAFAIGSPFGFSNTFTTGIVSRIDPDDGTIQTDASINPGNSGGPLLDSNAELVGVNTAIYTTGNSGGNIGIGFAIPVNRVEDFLAALDTGNAPAVAVRTGLPDVAPIETSLDAPPIDGQLVEGDNVLPSDSSLFDAYRFSGRAGQAVSIAMSSTELDSYLILLDENGSSVAFDDDSGGDLNALLQTVLPASGDYMLLANTYQSGQSGRYRLELSSGSGGGAMTTPPSASGSIIRQRGALQPGDSILPADGSLFDEYQFSGRAGQTVEIRLSSTDFDTYAILVNEAGESVEQNDDASEGTTNSYMVVRLPVTGRYTVLVNSYDATGRGNYSLEVNALD